MAASRVRVWEVRREGVVAQTVRDSASGRVSRCRWGEMEGDHQRVRDRRTSDRPPLGPVKDDLSRRRSRQDESITPRTGVGDRTRRA